MLKTKAFDCVEMMHQGAERVQDQTAGMTLEEELAYWQRGTEELRALLMKQRGHRRADEYDQLTQRGPERA